MDFNQLFGAGTTELGTTKDPVTKPTPAVGEGPALGTYDDQELLDLWEKFRKESLADRWVFERQWMRNIYYVLGRQWIEYHSKQGGWRDKRMAQWIPRPVTNKCKETLQAIRAMFTAIKLGVNVRPNGDDPQNVSAANTADELAPVLHENHKMNSVLSEFDFWLIATGNAFIHTYLNYDIQNGVSSIPKQECLGCGELVRADQLADDPACPTCGGTEFGLSEETDSMPVGKPMTCALSPLEIAFPNSYARFDDLPYVVRLRWRPKSYFENHPELKLLVATIAWEKSPSDTSLSLFKSLSNHNDLGITPIYWSEGQSSTGSEEGIAEYEVWHKPCDAYPDGLVFRVIGDKSPTILHMEQSEATPGPLPYKDAEGKPLFPYAHAGYEHVGGRVLASGPLDVIIQKQDALNRLDSHIELIVTRMSNPVWLEPKGADIEKLTGMPGLVIKWNPLTVGGNAKPERIAGEGPHSSLFAIREQYLKDIEELAGTFDIVKGAKPTGVEAFSALQLLVERSQSRFSGVFTSRGDAYKTWFKLALELEREFGPDELTKWTMSPARQWTYQTFKTSKLQGSVAIIVEDGSTVPKTNLGMRAAIEHANSLGMLNMQDPDQQYEGLKLFGLTKMVPTLDVHVQAALQKHKAFEDWLADPMAMQTSMMSMQQEQAGFAQQQASVPPPTADPMTGAIPPPVQPPSLLNPTPLKWKPWYSAKIHKQEFLKWANSDRIRQLMKDKPQAEQFLEMHLMEIDMAVAEQAMQDMMAATPMPPPGAGAGQTMKNSNRESTQGNEPKGNKEGAQKQGPA